MNNARARLVWLALATVIVVPLALAAQSPLLAWRQPVYIVAGFAGIIGLCLLLLQPLLAARLLPRVPPMKARQLHHLAGITLITAVVLHVVGLWITSPPDMVDALTFTSPTAFSPFGVVAMWAAFGAAALSILKPLHWRRAHLVLAVTTVIASVVHALLIEGTMETASKIVLCVCVLASLAALIRVRLRRR